MVIQYGLLEFFAPVFPLASLCALINNIIEIRSDAFKMCYLYQRPFGQRVGDIGKWQVQFLKNNTKNIFEMKGKIIIKGCD